MDQLENPASHVQNEVPAKGAEKPIKRRKKRKVLDGFTQLYRCYDKDEVLLYAGITFCGIARLISHRTTARWYKEIDFIKIDNFQTRRDALIAEFLVIRNEEPKHNGPLCSGRMYSQDEIDAFRARRGS